LNDLQKSFDREDARRNVVNYIDGE